MPGKIVSGWDPGGTTGYFIGELDSGAPAGFQVLESGIIQWHYRFSRIRLLLDRYRPSTSIVESFRLYRDKAQDQIGSTFPSAQVIGIIEAYCFMVGIAMPIYQPAATIAGKPPVLVLPIHTNLLYMGTKDMMEHSNDAYKHVRYWVEQHRQQTRVQPRYRS